jgi:hypothetical protein
MQTHSFFLSGTIAGTKFGVAKAAQIISVKILGDNKYYILRKTSFLFNDTDVFLALEQQTNCMRCHHILGKVLLMMLPF